MPRIMRQVSVITILVELKTRWKFGQSSADLSLMVAVRTDSELGERRG